MSRPKVLTPAEQSRLEYQLLRSQRADDLLPPPTGGSSQSAIAG